jgi:hypothetical protein
MKKAFLLAPIVFSLLSVSVLTAHAVDITPIATALPGTSTNCSTPGATSCDPAAYINDFYKFALLVGGILAFGSVVYGGIRYMTSVGNPSGQHEAREWIESALLGLLLLAGAYLILSIINPNLTRLALPTGLPTSAQSAAPNTTTN